MEISIPSSPLLCAPIPRRRTPTSQSLSFSSSRSSFFSNAAFSHRGSLSRVRVPRRTNRTGGLSCNCLFGLGVPELVVIAGVAALVFGPKKLPEVGRSIGKTVKSFQQAAKEFETELKKEPDSTAELPAEKPTAANEEEKEAKVPTTKENL